MLVYECVYFLLSAQRSDAVICGISGWYIEWRWESLLIGWEQGRLFGRGPPPRHCLHHLTWLWRNSTRPAYFLNYDFLSVSFFFNIIIVSNSLHENKKTFHLWSVSRFDYQISLILSNAILATHSWVSGLLFLRIIKVLCSVWTKLWHTLVVQW